ncbi:flagellar motor switch phosphatase FliY [Desemzia sp. FAM 23991]|uniref:flagellar motor switch phosphatase FliY n=1 Tax=unclassified Desemzia TaxID=2685243 RepID=UPI0038897007
MSEALSQEEIDMLLNGNSSASAEEPVESLTKDQLDIIGEVGNISMSQAATTLSTNLNHQVKITTPRVSTTTFKQIIEESATPKVATTVEFKEGLVGTNLLMIDVNDSAVIADLMMGGSGDVQSEELTELELSAVKEAMNQMIGSASTAMATMLGRAIDILPPNVIVLNEDNLDAHEELINNTGVVCKIAFDLDVEGILHSEIMQVFTLDTVKLIESLVMNDTAEVLQDRPQPQAAKVEQAPVVESQPAQPTEKVSVSKPQFPELSAKDSEKATNNLDLIMDVPLDFSVVLGESRKTIKDILSLGTGSVVELNKMTDEPLEIYVNGKLIAEGEVVVINESFGIRITNILSKEQRVKHLN